MALTAKDNHRTAAELRAFNDGFTHGRDGWSGSSNPYDEFGEKGLHDAWQDGWWAAYETWLGE